MTPLYFLESGDCWRGISRAYGTTFFVEIWKVSNPNLWRYVVSCAADSFVNESKKPHELNSVIKCVLAILGQHGLSNNDIEWSEIESQDLIHYGN